MPKAASKTRSLRRQGITVLVLLLAVGAYFAVFVPAQSSFLTKRYFRVLAGMGDQINEAVSNLGSSLVNATRPPPDLKTVNTNGSVYLTAIVRAGIDSAWDPSDQVHSLPLLVPKLDLIKATLGAASVPVENWMRPTGSHGPIAAAAAEGGAGELTVRVQGTGKASRLELEYRSRDAHLLARSDLGRLVEPIVDRGEFDDVLLLEDQGANGVVLFQLGSSALQASRLQVLSDRSFQTNLINYAGAEYLLFSQPLQLTPAVSTGGTARDPIAWTLCGLVRADRFAAQTRSVRYTVLVLFALLALLLVLSSPFLNVWSQGLMGGLRPGEVFLLIVASVAMNAFLTLLVLDLCAGQRMRQESNRQLEAFAGAIARNLHTELQQVARQMIALNDRFLARAVSQTSLLNQTNLIEVGTAPYPHFGMAFWMAAATGDQLAKWTVKERNTPRINVGHRTYFQALAESRPWLLHLDDGTGGDTNACLRFCLEPIFSANTGEYLATFSMRPTRTNDWQVVDYRVISALDCRLLSLVNAVVPAGFGFCVVDDDGKVLFHSDERRNLRENFFEECGQNPRLCAAVWGRQTSCFDARYASRDHTLLVRPLPDLPWSLVTFRDGRVLGTAQVEILSMATLMFLLYWGVFAAIIGLIYAVGARHYLAWLWPTDHRARAYGLLAVVNLALAAVFAGAIFLPTVAFWRLFAVLAIPPLAGLACLRGLSRGRLSSAWMRLIARCWRLRLPPRLGYVLSIGTLLLLVATLPMVAFFKTAFDTETRLLVKHTQLRLAEDYEARAQRIWAEIHGRTGPQRTKGGPLAIARPPEDSAQRRSADEREASSQGDFSGRRSFFNLRLTNRLDLYTEFFFNTQIRLTNGLQAAPLSVANSLLEQPLLSLRPHYNEQDVLTRSAAGGGTDDGAWFWTDRVHPSPDSGVGRRLQLIKTAIHVPARSGEHQLLIDSAEPGWGGVPWLWALAFLVPAGLPFFVIHVLGDRVLLLRFRRPATTQRCLLDPERLESQPPLASGKYLLLGPPRSGKSRQLVAERFARLQGDAFRKLDLRNPEDHQWLDPKQTDQLLSETHKAIVLDSLEYRHEDPAFTRKKLLFLRQLVFDEPRTIVVVSNIHPLHFCLAPAEPETADSETTVASEAAAWVDLLACFRKLYTQGQWIRSNTPEGQTALTARVLYRSIWRTCSPAEQELLYEVAQGRLVSSYQPELTTLLERGLLRRSPALRLADEPFQRFVLGTYRPGTVVHDAVREPPGLWQSLKGPAVTVFIILGIFLFVTQREMWTNTVALVTTFAAGIGALGKAFEMFPRSRLKQTPSE